MLSKIVLLFLAIISFSTCKPSAPSVDIPIPQFIQYELKSDSIGTIDGVTIFDGGYSALTFDEQGNLFALNDRGPNLDAENHNGKPAKRFPIPSYSPAISRILFDSGQVHLARDIALRTPSGEFFTGLPIPTDNKKLSVEYALDEDFEVIPNSELGIDSEGLIVIDSIAWVADEYAPSILTFERAGMTFQSRYTPISSDASAKLPSWLLNRQPNLGFEGLAYANGFLYAALQGPLSPRGGDPKTPLVRILRINVENGNVRHFIYPLDSYKRKIGDLAMHPNGNLLVLEHGLPKRGEWSAEIYMVNLAQVNYASEGALPAERFSDTPTALAGGLLVASKSLSLNLPAAGYPTELRKPEGLAVDRNGRIYIINDNDYGIDSPANNGRAVETTTKSFLFVLP